MQADFTTTSQGELVRRSHHGDSAVAQPHRGVLEHADGVVQFVPLLLDSQHENHADIGAGREIASFVADDESAPFGVALCDVDGLVEALEDFSTDGVHLGVEGDVQDAIAQILDGGAAVGPNRRLCAE